MIEEHALVVKTHWKSKAEDLRETLRTSQQEAEKRHPGNPGDVFAHRAGIEAYVARAALDLLDEVLQAAKDAEGNWGQAADAVILEQAGEGLPETEGTAE